MRIQVTRLIICRRTVEPGPGAFLCSCHFVDEKKENGPALMSNNFGNRFNYSMTAEQTRAHCEAPEKANGEYLIKESRYK